MHNLELSKSAVDKIKFIMAQTKMEPEATFLRVGIKGKSCSGPIYDFHLDENYDEENDRLIRQNGIKIVYENKFATDLSFVSIGYSEYENKKGFVFKDNNPLKILSNSSCSTCGGCSE
jgi:iron-sulfur cluster assembly accessory protein